LSTTSRRPPAATATRNDAIHQFGDCTTARSTIVGVHRTRASASARPTPIRSVNVPPTTLATSVPTTVAATSTPRPVADSPRNRRMSRAATAHVPQNTPKRANPRRTCSTPGV
jgi:hypothetical protein